MHTKTHNERTNDQTKRRPKKKECRTRCFLTFLLLAIPSDFTLIIIIIIMWPTAFGCVRVQFGCSLIIFIRIIPLIKSIAQWHIHWFESKYNTIMRAKRWKPFFFLSISFAFSVYHMLVVFLSLGDPHFNSMIFTSSIFRFHSEEITWYLHKYDGGGLNSRLPLYSLLRDCTWIIWTLYCWSMENHK